MTDQRPLLYLSRLLPEPVMAVVCQRFRLTGQPTESPPSPATISAGLREADAALVTLTERIDAAAIRQTRRLKILANYAVGYNNIDIEAAEKHGLAVSNTPDVLTDATADLTWTLLLAAARRVVEGDALVRSGGWTGWTPTQLLGAEVAGRTLGIVGMGRIGQAVARRASGFRMNVLYAAHRPAPEDSATHRWEWAPLPALLQQSDFVSLHVPLTPATHHLIDERELAMMRRTAILVNTARGPIVSETALADALVSGTIAGAGLDVYENEPAVHPTLASLKQAVLLPHLGSATWSARVQMGMICLRNIDAVLAGLPAPDRIAGPR